MYPYLRLHIFVKPIEARSPSARRPRTLCPRPRSKHPDLPTPLLRRVLGKALVDAFCSYGRPICQDKPSGAPPAPATERCHLAAHCPYGVLYARSLTQRPPFALFGSREAADDGSRTIELSLFGPACTLYSWALIALGRALDAGLGKERRRWAIEGVFKISQDGRRRRLCGQNLSLLPATVAPEHFGLTSDTYLPPRGLTVELLSPTRLVRDGRLLPKGQSVPFDLLIARVLDRFRELYGSDANLLRPGVRSGIEEAAARVPLVRDETRWIEVRDYSARMKSELLLGGLTGKLYYDRPATSFLPILRAGEILHLGKNPTSGCGRLRLEL